MIDKQALTKFIESRLEGTDLYLVDITISPDNSIVVEIDSDTSVDIDRCVELTRAIEAEFSRDDEDYDLEVGSCGLTSPFKVRRQYEKNRGKEVEVLAADGKKYKGLLQGVGEDSFTIISEEKVKKEGAKRPVVEKVERTFPYADVKYTKYLLQF
ncbi:MAG: ribosome assembly cofactor RimP [Bacteroides sp.]|nr:ribosome assembly cofactor RimP [Bacteroides sp.]